MKGKYRARDCLLCHQLLHEQRASRLRNRNVLAREAYNSIDSNLFLSLSFSVTYIALLVSVSNKFEVRNFKIWRTLDHADRVASNESIHVLTLLNIVLYQLS